MALDNRRRPSAADGGGHPDAERLAEYAEHTLAPDARSEVERHLAACAPCRDVVVDTAAFITAENERDWLNPFRGRRLRIAAATGLAAAAALVLAVRVLQPAPVRDTAEWQQLVATAAGQPTRPVEAFMTGFNYRPPPATTRGNDARPASPDIRIAAAEFERAVGGRHTADSAAALGTAYAVTGDFDRAVAALERAVERDATNAAYLSDLSAVYIARGRGRGGADDHARALAAAERAIAVDVAMVGACFNRGLALLLLSRRDEARAAWERCLTLNPPAAWAAEIGERLQRLTP